MKNRRSFWTDSQFLWRCIEEVFRARSLYETFRNVPDFRCVNKTKHELPEVLACITLGMLTGHLTLRSILIWCRRNLKRLQKSMTLKNGIPSLSTVSRILSGIDEELFIYEVMIWLGQLMKTQGHLAIDGKALKASASHIKDEKAPYILNAIDVATNLVVGHLPISEKTNEITYIPKLLDILDIKDSVITIDAIGTQTAIMKRILCKGGHFVLLVKMNHPETYKEMRLFFQNLKEDEKKRLNNKYSAVSKKEKNRERYEYRELTAVNDTEAFQRIKPEWPFVKTFGCLRQTRILKIEDEYGNDITPSLEEFQKYGSSRQKNPKTGDDEKDDIQIVGIISDLDLNAEQLLQIKRKHWTVENSLHHVLDEQFKEDKSSARKSRNNLALIRKVVFNLIQLAKRNRESDETMSTVDWMDLFSENPKLQRKYVFGHLSSLYEDN